MSLSAPYLKRAANGNYYVHWTENRVGKRISTGAKDLASAKEFFGSWLMMERRELEATGGPLGAHLTIAQLWKVYYDGQVVPNLASTATADYSWRLLEGHFGHLTLPDLSQMTIDSYVKERTSGRNRRKVKPQTVLRELAALFAALNFCAEPKRKLVAPELIPAVDLPPPGEPRDRWLKPDEIQKLVTAAGAIRRGDRLSRGERFLWIALETAARAAAIMELTWDRVDFETNTIHLDVPGRKLTKKRRAVVPISTALRPILLRAHAERQGELVMDNAAPIWATVQLIAIEAGLGGDQKKPSTSKKPKATGVSPHVLRHTAATHMARRGVPLWIIAKILGNTLAMVEKVYAKWAPDDLREAVNLISKGALEAAE